ncbi:MULTISPECIES: DNA-directed RNA polymerase subunit D [Haloarcula]|uniref:DNA-directed RNA polymerase subunit Rpo3 n=1 Tax=Haloarcula pellucida TaxID=1427151 RepID=A0A830GKS1_9EURY|nr:MULTISPECIES: DNA-directed RNA polymerase subunit D [Halomicroarcula]MBX0347820.1 DNA-directed RNA polymerase subunit D [Halomicroarcula pellucida]MDS0276246.1 DNA-directed RNA polymerase subunit D [Halomicroarcula sp. S1AR25-4]QIO23317.1 DNA-directed RNA polymerase subunit D [Haloarcula sp. JP-L23]GGN90448.1 DNA-directed RNA polymerase subunit D [Halomicroarcula pellucida]
MTQDYEVEFVERGERESLVLIRGITPAFANGIRRAMIADVPTFSIDTVRVIENTSVMFNEQIGLRLGLVPLTTDLDDFEIGDEVTLSLSVDGPATAYSSDLVSSDGLVKPADDNVPIIDLKDGQRLEVEADAVLDTGKEHAKHQGGVAVGYRHLQRVEVVGEKSEFEDDEPNILRGVIEEGAAEHAAVDATDGDLVPTDDFGNDLSQRYPGKEVEVTDVENAFVFHVETDGSFTTDELVLRAVETLRDRATELKDAVQL